MVHAAPQPAVSVSVLQIIVMGVPLCRAKSGARYTKEVLAGWPVLPSKCRVCHAMRVNVCHVCVVVTHESTGLLVFAVGGM